MWQEMSQKKVIGSNVLEKLSLVIRELNKSLKSSSSVILMGISIFQASHEILSTTESRDAEFLSAGKN